MGQDLGWVSRREGVKERWLLFKGAVGFVFEGAGRITSLS